MTTEEQTESKADGQHSLKKPDEDEGNNNDYNTNDEQRNEKQDCGKTDKEMG